MAGILKFHSQKIKVDSNAPSPNQTTRPHRGIMIYAQPELILHSYFHEKNAKSVVINFEVHTRNQHASHKQTSCTKRIIFASVLKDEPKKIQINAIAMGDFNIDQLEPSCALIILQNAMKSHFNVTTKQLKETSDRCSSLDHIYSNIPDIPVGSW